MAGISRYKIAATRSQPLLPLLATLLFFVVPAAVWLCGMEMPSCGQLEGGMEASSPRCIVCLNHGAVLEACEAFRLEATLPSMLHIGICKQKHLLCQRSFPPSLPVSCGLSNVRWVQRISKTERVKEAPPHWRVPSAQAWLTAFRPSSPSPCVRSRRSTSIQNRCPSLHP